MNEKVSVIARANLEYIAVFDRYCYDFSNHPVQRFGYKFGYGKDGWILTLANNADLGLRETHRGVCVNEYLSGGAFIFDKTWAADERNVYFNVNQLLNRKGMLVLLHEIGHTQDRTVPYPGHIPYLFAKLHSILKRFTDSEQDNELPMWYKEWGFKRTAQSERNAWANALWISRDLKRKGIDLVGEFEDFKQVKNTIDRCLATYENDRLLAHLEAAKPGEKAKVLDEYKPIFIRKSKKTPILEKFRNLSLAA
jgi:hypothetical protein